MAQNKNPQKAVLIGGHPTPALALIEVMQSKGWELYWYGEKNAIEGTFVKTLEYQVIPNLGIPFFPIVATKFHRNNPLKTILSIWKILVGFIQSLTYLMRDKPSIVISFGSYLSMPVVLAAWVLRIPLLLHEQTAASGLSNRLASNFANSIALSNTESTSFFPKKKVVLTGNPIRTSLIKLAEKKDNIVPKKEKTIFITGGSRGSQTINNIIFGLIPRLTKHYKIIHQTGELDFEKAPKIENYYPTQSFTLAEMEKAYLEANIIISRAGANTVSEIGLLGTPAILIPIPVTDSDEQTKNAQILEKVGLAIHLPQNQLSSKSLTDALEKIDKNYNDYAKNKTSSRKLVSPDSAKRLYELVEKTAKIPQ